MTVRTPEKNILDRILSLFGKRRGVIIPDGIYQKHGPHVYAMAKRESFWRALLRPKNASLPENVIDSDQLNDSEETGRNKPETL